jgi:hypothetical protein
LYGWSYLRCLNRHPPARVPRVQITAGRDGLKRPHCRGHSALAMTKQYLNHHLECPYCLIVRLRIPAEAGPEAQIVCDDCGEFLGVWDDLLTDFEKQGGNAGIFRLDKGRIKRID